MKDEETLDEIEDVIAELVAVGVAKMHVGCWASVVTYSPSTQTCSARPVVRGAIKGGGSFRFPIISRVPVKFPAGGGFSITWPIKAGDQVWLDFGDRSIDEWSNSSNPSDIEPSSKRRFHITDAVAYPGGRPGAKPLKLANTDDIVLGQDSYGGTIINPGKSSPLQLAIGPSGIALGDGTTINDLPNILDRVITSLSLDPGLTSATRSALLAEKVLLALIKR